MKVGKFLVLVTLGCGLSGCMAFDRAMTGDNDIKCEPKVGFSKAEVEECLGSPKKLIHSESNTLGKLASYEYGVRKGNWKTGIKHYAIAVTYLDEKVIRIEGYQHGW